MKKFALVLGGGAAKGFAHIGVIKVLAEHNLKPDLIVGTSMGAIIGGAYASGMTIDKMEEFAENISSNKVIDVSIINMVKTGFVLKGKKLEKIVRELLGTVTHENLEIPFVAVATDLSTGKQVNLNTGRVWKNVLASSAIPAVFPAVKINGKTLSDGGLKDNVPASLAKNLMKDAIILSVDVIGDYEKQVETEGVKVINQILNMGTLLMDQNMERDKNISDIYLKITQPEVKQMGFKKDAIVKAISNGETAMRKNINKLKGLLKN